MKKNDKHLKWGNQENHWNIRRGTGVEYLSIAILREPLASRMLQIRNLKGWIGTGTHGDPKHDMFQASTVANRHRYSCIMSLILFFIVLYMFTVIYINTKKH